MSNAIIIPSGLLSQMMDYGAGNLPYESCGVVLGTKSDTEWMISRFEPIANIACHKEHSFLMDPQQLIPYLFASDFKLIGIVHTHPTQSPYPSSKDLNPSWSLVPTHWIISYKIPQQPRVACYRYSRTATGLQVDQVHLNIV